MEATIWWSTDGLVNSVIHCLVASVKSGVSPECEEARLPAIIRKGEQPTPRA